MALFDLPPFYESKNPTGPEACFNIKNERGRSTQCNDLLEAHIRNGEAVDINQLLPRSTALALGPLQ